MAYDFSKSDFILMIGGQIIFFVLLILVVYFGMEPISTFPYANEVRTQVNILSSAKPNANAKSNVNAKSNA